MAIANWGTAVIFSVSENKVFTFRNMSRTVGSSWATHSRIGLKDQVEFLRPNLQKLNFEIALDFNYGVDPRAIIERMERAAEMGEIHPFIVGGRPVGRLWWRLTDVSEAWETIYNNGVLTNAKLNITMSEYL